MHELNVHQSTTRFRKNSATSFDFLSSIPQAEEVMKSKKQFHYRLGKLFEMNLVKLKQFQF